MGRLLEISRHFHSSLEKHNTRILIEKLFPMGGTVEDYGTVKGLIGRLGWVVKPEVWWNVRCAETGKLYRVHFKTGETAIGDISYFNCGDSFRNFTYVLDEKALIEGIDSFLKDGGKNKIEKVGN